MRKDRPGPSQSHFDDLENLPTVCRQRQDEERLLGTGGSLSLCSAAPEADRAPHNPGEWRRAKKRFVNENKDPNANHQPHLTFATPDNAFLQLSLSTSFAQNLAAESEPRPKLYRYSQSYLSFNCISGTVTPN